MRIEIAGTTDKRLRTQVEDRIQALMEGIEGEATRVTVTFSDDNGPKGGLDRRCAMTVHVPRRPMFRAEDVAKTPRLAFDGSLDALAKQIARYRERMVERARFPKKYFAAKTLLTDAAPRPVRARRVRRRKEA